MGNNIYGIVKPSLINIGQDVDIFYNYRPSRTAVDTEFQNFKHIDTPESILSISNSETSETGDLRLPGMYNLNLPASIFGKKGIYTVYIVPKQIYCNILDVGSLSAYPDIRGIVIDVNTMTQYRDYFKNNNLVGYRVEYFTYEGDGLKRQEYFRIITSCNLCEPVSQNLTNSYANSNGYRYNESGTLCFITLTPSTSSGFRPNATPYIGVPSQKIAISNTKFDPVCLEVSVVEHDIETLSIMAEGDQIRNLENGRVTTYDFDNQIFKQIEMFSVKDSYTGTPIAEAKIDVSNNIDTSLNIEDFKN